MSDDVKLIYREGMHDLDVPGYGAPRGNTRESLVARNSLAEFLDATLLRPLYFSEEQQMARVEQSLNTMTIAERIAIEIEMTERSKVFHSFDYDPL
jgi:hypothetical protein